MRSLSIQEANDILIGCTILATGGGGELHLGFDAMRLCYEQGQEVKLLDFSEIREDAHYVTSGMVGAVSDDAILPVEDELDMMCHAVETLQEYLGIEFEGLVSTEYGGGNTGEGMAVAARLGKCFIDGDAAGRAVPMLQQSTYYIMDQSTCPMAAVTQYGDNILINKTLNDERLEEITRALAVASGNLIAVADHSISGKNLKKSIIPSALSYAEKVGKAQRQALEGNLDPIVAITQAGDGYLLFRGIVGEETEWETKNGFTIGTVYMNGIEDYAGQHFKLWYQNEHMISWKNDEVYVTCPDLLCVVNNSTGHPVTNPNCNKGDEVAVLGFKANEFWRTEKGFAMLNPRFFNYDIEHIAIEKQL